MPEDDHTNSMSFVYAQIIEDEIKKEEPDKDTILEMCQCIKKYCQTVAYEKGETPEHLKEYQFEEGEGEGETGTVMVDGKPIPKTAAEKLNRDERRGKNDRSNR